MKTTQECYQALIDGWTLIRNGGATVKLNNGMLNDNKGNYVTYLFDLPQDWSIYTPPKWYDNIPEHGVLCWWGDDRSTPVIIHSVDVDGWFVDRTGEAYADATPLTKQEIQTLLDNAPGED